MPNPSNNRQNNAPGQRPQRPATTPAPDTTATPPAPDATTTPPGASTTPPSSNAPAFDFGALALGVNSLTSRARLGDSGEWTQNRLRSADGLSVAVGKDATTGAPVLTLARDSFDGEANAPAPYVRKVVDGRVSLTVDYGALALAFATPEGAREVVAALLNGALLWFKGDKLVSPVTTDASNATASAGGKQADEWESNVREVVILTGRQGGAFTAPLHKPTVEAATSLRGVREPARGLLDALEVAEKKRKGDSVALAFFGLLRGALTPPAPATPPATSDATATTTPATVPA